MARPVLMLVTLVVAATTSGCYDWVPTSVDWVRAHPYDAVRVTDSEGQSVLADHVVVDDKEMLLAPRPPESCVAHENAEALAICYASDLERRRDEIARVDFVPKAPRLERRRLNGGKTALLAGGVFLGVAAVAAAVTVAVFFANWNVGFPSHLDW